MQAGLDEVKQRVQRVVVVAEQLTPISGVLRTLLSGGETCWTVLDADEQQLDELRSQGLHVTLQLSWSVSNPQRVFEIRMASLLWPSGLVMGLIAWDGPFVWSSRGSSAEFLHRCGVQVCDLRRMELLAGALLCLPAFSLPALICSHSDEPWGPLSCSLLLVLSLLFLRCAHEPLRITRISFRVRDACAAGLGWFGLLWVILYALGLRLEEFERLLAAIPWLGPLLIVGIVAATCGLWWRAWVRSSDEWRLE